MNNQINPNLDFDPVALNAAAKEFAEKNKDHFYNKIYTRAISSKRVGTTERFGDMEFYVRQRCRDSFSELTDRRHFDALCEVLEINNRDPFKFKPLDYEKVDKVVEWLVDMTYSMKALNMQQSEIEGL